MGHDPLKVFGARITTIVLSMIGRTIYDATPVRIAGRTGK
jgi:hypothetical protein